MILRLLDRKNRLLLARKDLQLLMCRREDPLPIKERCLAAEAATAELGSHVSAGPALVISEGQGGNRQCSDS